LVLFATPAKPTAARGGRAGLDADCEATRATLGLKQTKSHAFITVSSDDCIANWINADKLVFSDLPFDKDKKTPAVVGPTGIEIAPSLTSLIQGTVERSLVCAQVLPSNSEFWLSGSSPIGIPDPITQVYVYGQFSLPDDNCTGWNSGVHDPVIRGRPGSAIYADQRLLCAAQTPTQVSFLYIQCDTTSDSPVLCLAYTP
jgi:hypothetical protein